MIPDCADWRQILHWIKCRDKYSKERLIRHLQDEVNIRVAQAETIRKGIQIIRTELDNDGLEGCDSVT